MSLSAAFLPNRAKMEGDELIAANVETLLQSVVPGPVVSSSLPCVKASNLSFGVSMNWALSDSERSEQVRANLRERLQLFEPRLLSIDGIGLKEDDQSNLVEFSIEGIVGRGKEHLDIEVTSRLSLMDQAVVEETP